MISFLRARGLAWLEHSFGFKTKVKLIFVRLLLDDLEIERSRVQIAPGSSYSSNNHIKSYKKEKYLYN